MSRYCLQTSKTPSRTWVYAEVVSHKHPVDKCHSTRRHTTQFHLAYETGIDDLWVINVGDLKPKELPIDFILRYAWNPHNIPADKTDDYTREWAAQNFGDEYAEEIADIVSKYPKYNLWRKAEVQVAGIFSVVNHRETDRVEKL